MNQKTYTVRPFAKLGRTYILGEKTYRLYRVCLWAAVIVIGLIAVLQAWGSPENPVHMSEPMFYFMLMAIFIASCCFQLLIVWRFKLGTSRQAAYVNPVDAKIRRILPYIGMTIGSIMAIASAYAFYLAVDAEKFEELVQIGGLFLLAFIFTLKIYYRLKRKKRVLKRFSNTKK